MDANAPPPERSIAGVVAAFAVVYVVWGSTYLAIRFVIESLPGFLTASVRFLVAGAIVYAWARLGGAARPTALEWRSAAIVGAFLLLGGNGSVVFAEHTVPSSIAALIIAGMPFWVVLIDWARPGGARPAGVVLLGLAIGFVGLAILLDPFAAIASGGIDPLGAAVLVAGSFCWAFGSTLAPRLALPRSLLLGTAMEMLAGGALLGLVAIASGDLARLDLGAASFRSVGALVYLIVFGSILAFNAFVYLLRVVPPARVATYAFVNPLVAVLLGWLFAGEEIGARAGFATAIIVPGVALVTFGRSSPRTAPVPAGDPATP